MLGLRAAQLEFVFSTPGLALSFLASYLADIFKPDDLFPTGLQQRCWEASGTLSLVLFTYHFWLIRLYSLW